MGFSIGVGGDVEYYERDADNECEPNHVETPVVDLHEQQPRANEYYTGGAHGARELNGFWRGPGSAKLGLTGKVTSWQLHQFYGKHVNPITMEHLGPKPRKFRSREERLAEKLAKEPFATPDRIREIELSTNEHTQQNRNFFDVTASVPKSYSETYVSWLYGGRTREAEQLLQDLYYCIDEAFKIYMAEAGYSRTGHHGKKVAGWTSGQRIDAHDWNYSFFPHFVSRAGDPQLHVHVLVNNVVECADKKWRTIDSRALFKQALTNGSVFERLLAERTAQTLGLKHAPRADGMGWEVAGVSEDEIKMFSRRRLAIEQTAERLIAEYKAEHGVEPTGKRLDEIMQRATMVSRPPKPHDRTFEEYLEFWDQRMRHERGEGLASIGERVLEAAGRPAEPTSVDRRRVIQMALANLDERYPTWGRVELRRALSDLLPPSLGRANADDLLPYLDSLVDEAIAGDAVVTLSQPAAVEAPEALRFANGRSIYEPFHVERFTTRNRLPKENNLKTLAQRTDGPRITERDAALLLDQTTLYDDQRAVAHAVLTSGRRLTFLEAVAGAGKTYTEGRISELWFQAFGEQVIGLSKNNNAAEELGRAGVSRTMNFDLFRRAHEALAEGVENKKQRDTMLKRYGVNPRTLLMVDEITTLSDEERFWLEEFARSTNVPMFWVGDRGQVQSVGANATLDLVAEATPPLKLDTPRRFKHEWERKNSVGLHDAEAQAIVQYERHGRIISGTREEMDAKALDYLVADLVEGRNALLMVPRTDLADELAGRVQQRLIELGLVDPSKGHVVLEGGHRRLYVGDIGSARLTGRDLAGFGPGESISNRDLFHVKQIHTDGSATVLPIIDHGPDGPIYDKERRIPDWYLRDHTEPAYVTTVHSKIGRTVDRAYALGLDPNDWNVVYTAMTRGADSNVIFVPVAHEDGVPTETGADVLMRAAEKYREGLGDIERASATEALRQELDAVTHLARLGPIYDNELLKHSRADNEAILSGILGSRLTKRLKAEAEAEPLYRLMRALKREGHDVEAVVREAVNERALDDADSMARVIHYRITKNVGEIPEPVDERFVDAVPAGDTPELNYVRAVAEKMDQRVQELGERQVTKPEPWAVKHLGPVPSDPVERLEWAERAGKVAAYRERFGFDEPDRAIGDAPGRQAVEERNSWERAFVALGRPVENEDVVRLSDGELLLNIERQRRIDAWLPPDVSQKLQSTATAAREYEAQAVLDRARGDNESAELSESLARTMAARAAKYEEIHEARRRGEQRYAAERRLANASQLEYEYRHPSAERSDGERFEEQEAAAERQREAHNWTIDDALDRARQVDRELDAEREREEYEAYEHQHEAEQARDDRGGYYR